MRMDLPLAGDHASRFLPWLLALLVFLAALRKARPDLQVVLSTTTSTGYALARERLPADVVLLDDNFATIVRAIRQGRRVFGDLQRAFLYLLAFHPPLLAGTILPPLLGLPFMRPYLSSVVEDARA